MTGRWSFAAFALFVLTQSCTVRQFGCTPQDNCVGTDTEPCTEEGRCTRDGAPLHTLHYEPIVLHPGGVVRLAPSDKPLEGRIEVSVIGIANPPAVSVVVAGQPVAAVSHDPSAGTGATVWAFDTAVFAQSPEIEVRLGDDPVRPGSTWNMTISLATIVPQCSHCTGD